MIKLLLTMILAGLLIFGYSLGAEAFEQTCLNLTPAKDTYVTSQRHDKKTNFANESFVQIINAPSQTERAFMEYDLSQIPSGSNIISALWKPQIFQRFPDDMPLEFFEIKTSWDELAVTWTNQPKIVNKPFLSTTSNPFDLDLAAFIRSHYQTGDPADFSIRTRETPTKGAFIESGLIRWGDGALLEVCYE